MGRHGVQRWGAAHTAGSDALLTLELFLLSRRAKTEHNTFGRLWEPRNEMNRRSEDDWYQASAETWMTPPWENSVWTPERRTINDWPSYSAMATTSPAWYSTGAYLPWSAY